MSALERLLDRLPILRSIRAEQRRRDHRAAVLKQRAERVAGRAERLAERYRRLDGIR